MATLLLSAAGAAVGSGIGGSVLGLSGAVVGRAVGATLGQSFDQKVFGSANGTTSSGKIDRFHLSGVGYGTPIKQVWGRMRIAGEIIWASRFLETRSVSSGGKGTRGPSSEAFSYTVSIAIALCEGEALTVGRVWADGTEIAMNSLDLRFYSGSDDQLPDPKIEAVEGEGFAPSYRGTCYVLIENLEIGRFGNRVPQFSFEVIRRANSQTETDYSDLPSSIHAVALIPGSGEYALATTPVHFNLGIGTNKSANVHTIQRMTDFSSSLLQLSNELPLCKSVSLVVSWFGSDLRCNECSLQPKVDQKDMDGVEMPWVVSGVVRSAAAALRKIDGKPVFGGTPTDQSVKEAIAAIRSSGKEVMFYPFILMDQLAEDLLPDPWMDQQFQPDLPWRGRITMSVAPGIAGTPDQTSGAAAQILKFMGNAKIEDFVYSDDTVEYHGAPDWGYRRFILHYAHLCVLAGGVDSFCIGSEMRGLTISRSSISDFPMVTALKQLAADVKQVLGAATQITYAADWSEYFGYRIDDNVFFHLDSLWSDPNIDFIGIDNYMPLTDWRDGLNHADVHWSSEYNVNYLLANVMGGEGYEWYYDSVEGEEAQRRLLIKDDAYGEDWVFRFKDIRSWWENDHHNRLSGVRSEISTDWIPQSKKIIFTEYGCAAVNKGANHPNRFIDLKSSESALPRGSNGSRDDLVQLTYYEAMARFWRNSENNPTSRVFDGPMIDFDRSHAWAWDARPFPDFPGAVQLWSDAPNYDRGHWLNGRTSNQPAQMVIRDIFDYVDKNINLDNSSAYGVVRGYVIDSSQPPRSSLDRLLTVQRLQLRENEGKFEVVSINGIETFTITPEDLVAPLTPDYLVSKQRNTAIDIISQLRLIFVQAESDHEVQIAEAFIENSFNSSVDFEISLLALHAEAMSISEHLLMYYHSLNRVLRITVANSMSAVLVGDLITFEGRQYWVSDIAESYSLTLEVREIARACDLTVEVNSFRPLRIPSVAPTPIFCTLLDLPILDDNEADYAPFAAVASTPWPGSVSIWSSASSSGFELNEIVSFPSVLGETLSQVRFAPSGVWDCGNVFRVKLTSGFLESRQRLDVLNGSNVMAIGTRYSDDWEILQFVNAEVVGTNTYDVSLLLRGLAGTDATTPPMWPAGSMVVLIDQSLKKVSLPRSLIGLERFYRVGASDLGVSDVNTVSFSRSFAGIGFRPYSVVHLTASRTIGGGILFKWIRRSRIDGDRWHYGDVPLSEEFHEFTLRVVVGVHVVRELICVNSFFNYESSMQVMDGLSGPFVFSVSQNSSSFGLGPETSILMV